MKRTFVLICLIAMIASAAGCSSGTSAASGTPEPTPALTFQRITGASASLVSSPAPSIAVPVSSPSPTLDPLTAMFQTPDDPGQKIGTFVVSDNSAIYYADKHSVYKLDKATLRKTKLFDTHDDIIFMFLDSEGCLYYSGMDDSGYIIVKFDGKKKTVISDAFFLKVDNSYVYYVTDEEHSSVRKYNTANGKTDDVDIPHNGMIKDVKMLKNKSLALVEYTWELDTGEFLCDYNTGSLVDAHDNEGCYQIAEDENSVLFYNKEVIRIYSLTGEFSPIEIPNTFSSGQFGFPFEVFICDGKELQYEDGGSIYVVDLSTGKQIQKNEIVEGGDSLLMCRVYNGKWYLLSQVALKYAATPDAEVSKALPILYTFDIQTHELKCVWKPAAYTNNNRVSLDIEIDSGYLWIYNNLFDNDNQTDFTEFWKRFPLADLDK